MTLFKDGTYEYKPTSDTGGIDSFKYTTTSNVGTKQTATLDINVGLSLSGSAENDTVKSSVSIDTFTLKEGADTVLYDVLNQGLHQGQPDTWNDFNLEEGDKVDISALLQDQKVTADTIGNYVKVELRENDTVVKIDLDAKETHYKPVELIVLKNTDLTNVGLDEFLKYNHV